MKTGVMKVNDGAGGVDVVTVKAQGTTFQTTGSVMMNEETTTDGETFIKVMVSHCVSGEDMASMWLANEKGTDARLVIILILIMLLVVLKLLRAVVLHGMRTTLLWVV
jgi:hypothetical protein